MFKKAPHVGDVILSTEKEKLDNLFKMLIGIIDERKKLFVDYNGSYDFYINHGGKQIPTIIVMINNVEGFLDTYNEYEELIGQITRDCLKYGVIFILSTNGPNTVRYRLRQNFKQNVVLQFNDASDYGTIISGVRKKEPSKVYGRGLIQLEGIYEFQTAYAYKEEKLTEYIKIICDKLQTICEYKAKNVPILPEVVTGSLLKNSFVNLQKIPVGINKETLEISTINLSLTGIYTVTGEDISSNTAFLENWLKLLQSREGIKCHVIDGNSILNANNLKNINYNSSDNLEKTLNSIYEDTNAVHICMILSINNILNKMSVTDKSKITELLDKVKLSSNVKIIVVDTIDSIKAINFETWFKSNVSLSDGIWLGNGIANQFTLKVTTNSRILRAEVEPNFGYVITKGKAALTKWITEE